VGNKPVRARRQHARGEGALLRDELVAAATAVLRRAGDASEVTVRSVAAVARVSPAAVYLHFDTRDDLVDAAMRALFAELESSLEQSTRGRRTARSRVRAIALAYHRFAVDHPGAYAAMINDMASDWDQLSVEDLPGIGALARLEHELAQAGLANRLTPRAAALHLWSALHGQLLLRRAVPQLPWSAPGRTVDELLGLLLASPVSGAR
jgi:AcrR family transcriptional regulator